MSLDPIPPGGDVFTEGDLAPSADEKRAVRNSRIDKAAAIVAAIALGVWLGGTVALGACAAPKVFELTPYPFSGKAMGAAFMRFDMIAIGCAVVALAAEVTRTLLTLKRRSRKGAIVTRIRRYLLIFFAMGVVYTGTQISPAIMELHETGVRRNVGAEGAELERIHAQAELTGKVNALFALVLITLHVATIRSPYDELEDDDEEVYAPAPPGPSPD
ncbi:MAG TPA: DUF4149 domain-containing protein [Polyangiaceae bacterium]|nr:DUF4149 domain-containing protein [Polyangiaceae bacterium]